MVDDFMVCVDRIITSACFEAVKKEGLHGGGSSGGGVVRGNGESSNRLEKKGEIIECRICQEEDDEQHMEAPCACNGTLKFAHRKCIQRWCNKKGDITCEICNQVYAPNYTIAQRPSSDVLTIDIRQSWGPLLDVHDPRYLAFAAEQRLYEDYATENSSNIACCRAIALILMALLLVRHVLIITKESGIMEDASAFFNASFLQFSGLLLSCYVLGRALYIIQSRRRRQQG